MGENKLRIRNLTTKILSNNWYLLKKVTYEYLQQSGIWQSQQREVYERGHGAAILLYNKEKQTVLLIKQLRIPTFLEGHASGMLLEVCAGLLDEDDPETCIKRETLEETGYKVTQVQKIYEAYMSPGAVTEKIHFFVGAYSDDQRITMGGGLEDEHEDIEVLEMDFNKAYEMISQGAIVDAKTILLLQYAQLHNLLHTD